MKTVRGNNFSKSAFEFPTKTTENLQRQKASLAKKFADFFN